MKKVFAILGIIIIVLAGYLWFFVFHSKKQHSDADKPMPLSVSKHSAIFNSSVENVLNAYFSMQEGFVNWDTIVINSSAIVLKQALDSLKIQELQKDSAIYLTALDPLANAKIETESIIADPSIEEKRGSLNILSDNLRNLLVIVKYDQQKIYWQECPMAFGDEKPGNWLSKTNKVRNPYLGTKDPIYGSDMLGCGGPKDTINFIPIDTIQK
ncbi:MAG: DUF3347 domain-containing protein [Bacteroidota bacterium]